jgi:hypothetical protein
MAKRLIDSTDWDTQWFRRLPPKYKCLWYLMNLRSNHYGIWDVDLEIAEIIIGEKLVFAEILEHFGDKIFIIDEDSKWFIPSVLLNSYNNKINFETTKDPKNQLHKNSYPALLELGIIDPSGRVKKDLNKTLRALKNINKNIHKEKSDGISLNEEEKISQNKTQSNSLHKSEEKVIEEMFEVKKKGRVLEDNSNDFGYGEPDGFREQ